MKQTRPIDQIIEAFGLDCGKVDTQWMLAERSSLVKDENGSDVEGDFNYVSVVDILLYFSGHTCPDITHAVNYCARYMFKPKLSHEKLLKRIGHYF